MNIKYQKTLKSLTNAVQLLHNKTILITGATGLIGRNIVSFVDFVNKNTEYSINLVLVSRSLQKLTEIFSNYQNEDRFKFFQIKSNDYESIDVPIDYIIHGASITDSSSFVKVPVETLTTLFDGGKAILNFSMKKNIKKIINLSSLEVYGIPNNELVSENDYGYIDIMNVRSSYSEGKRVTETLFLSYFSQYSIPIINARLTQSFGSGVDSTDNRVFSQFAKAIVQSNDIVLNTSGLTKRCYCHVLDVVQALFVLLSDGQAGEAYNVANPATYISIKEMANFVIEQFGNQQSLILPTNDLSAEKFGYNPIMQIDLDISKLEKLGFQPNFDLYDMYSDLINSFIVNNY